MGNDNTLQKDDKDTLTAQIFDVIDFYPQSIDEILKKMNSKFTGDFRQEEVLSKLMQLCLLGQIKQDSSSWFSKR